MLRDRLRSFLLGLGLLGPSVGEAAPPQPPAPPRAARTLTAAEAEARGLPRLGFALEHTGAMMYLPFPEADSYATLSGPPGGPLSFTVLSLRGAPSYAAMEKLLRERAARLRWEALTPFQRGALQVAGERREALGFLAHQSMARTRYCAVLLPGQGAGLVLLFGHGQMQGDDAGCEGTARHRELAPILASFKLLK